MPSKGNEKNKIDFKARLEKKLWLARDNPEPIFDLSDCNLQSVPNNIYSLCKVFRKDALYIQNNKLSSLSGGGKLEDLVLLSVLDISSNNFTKLPNDINALENLKVLNISKNQLKDIPETIGSLKHLRHLDASYNQLKTLPKSIGECESIEYLNIEGNKDLKALPTTLSKLHKISQLIIDHDIVYPPPDICNKGIQAIVKYLAKDYGEDCYYEYSDVQCGTSKNIDLPTDAYEVLQEKIRLLEAAKEEKQKELLAVEEQLLNENRREVEMQQILKDRKRELINVVKTQQQCLDEDIMKLQETRENQRALLIRECNNAEENANLKIKQILVYNNAMREKITRLSEKERKEEEDLLLNMQQNYREIKPMERASLLASMNEILQEEIRRADAQSCDKRVKIMQTLISEDKKKFENLRACMNRFEKNHNELIETISHNEELQRSAVSSLLEKSDARLWQIRNQIAAIEAQLSVLTQVELTRRKLEAEIHLTELGKNRMLLTELLMELFRQQSERRMQLVESLRRIENAKDSDSFWLEQYQKLLQSKSQQLVEHLKSIDPDLIDEFFLMGIIHYLPILSNYINASLSELEKLTLKNFEDAGVESKNDQKKILQAIQTYVRKKTVSPSAPIDTSASAPAMLPTDLDEYRKCMDESTECVICLDAKADVIFVSCGHICCCENCSTSINICPLCRAPIRHILQVTPR